MDEYDLMNKASLKFKGQKKKKRKKSSKASTSELSNQRAGQSSKVDERAEDADDHGGWWTVTKCEHIRDDVILEFLPGCYAKALSNGKIVLGDPHPPGDGPEEEEIFTAIFAGTNQFALKSGFGRYLTVDKKKRLMGLSEAIGECETFQPVIEDGKTAISAYNDCFLAVDNESDNKQILATSMRAGPNEWVNIRVIGDPLMLGKQLAETIDPTKAGSFGEEFDPELNYLKKNKQINPDSYKEEKKRLKTARQGGHLRETLLDTRAKLKSDKYCK